MVFNSAGFWLFFAVTALACHAASARWHRAVLVVVSFMFYGTWNPALTVLLAGCIALNFASGHAIGGAPPRRARMLLAAAVAADLLLLGFFKYYDFFAGTVAGLLHQPPDAFILHVVLPVGISFFTFEAIAYNVDIYNGTLKPRGLLDFAVFIAFFPHLVAGPIIRPAQFFPQFGTRPAVSGDDIAWGVAQAVKGLVKKTVFADNLAAVADAYFNRNAGHAGMLAAWCGTLAFSLQIYFDFSGYTDIARGCARLLGYDLPGNFERPYLAASVAEFWRRWHISLSIWLRDYLYVPLGGNRHGMPRTCANLLITMGLGGFWHGANWNFVVWGLYHGALLCLHRIWRQQRVCGARPSGIACRALSVAFTFMLVTLGWVVFRTADLAAAAQVLRELFAGPIQPAPGLPLAFLALTAASLGWVALDRGRRVQDWLLRGAGGAAACRAAVALAVCGLLLEAFARTDIAVPFIYFRF